MILSCDCGNVVSTGDPAGAAGLDGARAPGSAVVQVPFCQSGPEDGRLT